MNTRGGLAWDDVSSSKILLLLHCKQRSVSLYC